ncbi:AraC family transcriptional regulator [Pseudomonas segetis]|nr:AraC family transcriptional regulator [Pseudomonas segetis]
MKADDFMHLTSIMVGAVYANLPRLDPHINIAGVYGRYEGVSFRHMLYSGDFTIELPPISDEITFVLPVAGKIMFNQASDLVGVPSVGLAMDKADLRSTRFIDSHEQYGFSIRRGLFAERLSTLLGKPIVNSVRFQPMVDLGQPAFAGLRSLLEFATGAEADVLINSSALMPMRIQEMLVDAVLESWPHNYTDALQHKGPLIAPRHVKLAVEFIQEHPDASINSAQLAELCNVSLRALQDGFRRFMGTSIAAYQRQVRLERAHGAIVQDPSRSIAEIALGLGFTNMGRFSQYFQNAFGQSPLDVKNAIRRR